MGENRRAALAALHPTGPSVLNEDDFGEPVSDRNLKSPGNDAFGPESSPSPESLIEEIDDVTRQIEHQLAEDVAHAEASRQQLQKTLDEIRLRQERTDRNLLRAG